MPNSPIIEKKIESIEKGLFDLLTYDMCDDGSPVVKSEYYEREDFIKQIRSSLQEVEEETRKEIVGKIEGARVDTENLPSNAPADVVFQMRNDMRQFGLGFNSALDHLLTLIQKK